MYIYIYHVSYNHICFTWCLFTKKKLMAQSLWSVWPMSAMIPGETSPIVAPCQPLPRQRQSILGSTEKGTLRSTPVWPARNDRDTVSTTNYLNKIFNDHRLYSSCLLLFWFMREIYLVVAMPKSAKMP